MGRRLWGQQKNNGTAHYPIAGTAKRKQSDIAFDGFSVHCDNYASVYGMGYGNDIERVGKRVNPVAPYRAGNVKNPAPDLYNNR